MDCKKYNLLYDASVLGDAYRPNASRSGIFFVAHNVLKELSKNKDINLALFVNSSSLIFLYKYLSIEFENYNFKIYTDTIFTKFTNSFYSISNYRKILKKENKPIKRFLLKIVMFIMKPFVKFFNFIGKNILEYKIKNFNGFLSPIYKAPHKLQKMKNLNKFIILHDAIPIILPQFQESQQHPKSWYQQLLKNINSKDHYFTVSEHTRKDFLKYCPQIDPNKIKTTLLACNENFKLMAEDSIKKAKEKYNIPSDKKYIFSLCTLEPRKNLIRAVKTFIQFIKKNNIEDLVFVLGGGQWDSFIGQLENEIDNLGEYKSKIIKAGYVDDKDLAPLYSGAEWFVYTSQYEGFGLPPLEAMSCGCPVITSNNSSLPEVVGDSAIMIDYDSDEQHIKAYEKYYYNEDLRKEYSQKGLKRASLFSWKNCANQMLEEMINNG